MIHFKDETLKRKKTILLTKETRLKGRYMRKKPLIQACLNKILVLNHIIREYRRTRGAIGSQVYTYSAGMQEQLAFVKRGVWH